MIRASGAARPGCPAKVKAPLGGVRINSRPGVHAAGRGARPRVPGDIVGVAPHALPHQPGAIDSAEPRVELWIARLEEHTSELQSIKRIQSPGSCLKNKIKYTQSSWTY